jgi:predicted RNase H-like HicB family nuclease
MPRNKVAARQVRVVFEPDDGGWHVSVPSIQGCRTWGRSISAARKNIREAIGACSDVLGDDAVRIGLEAALVEDFRLPAGAKKAVVRALKEREALENQVSVAKDATKVAAQRLTSDVGLSLRDVGDLLGLSHERIKQIAGG